MDSQLSNTPELPSPSRGVDIFEPESAPKIEKESLKLEMVNSNPLPKQTTLSPQVSVPVTQTQSVSSDASNSSTAFSSQKADDVDLIEKEWVSKAKSVINSTRSDPRQQNIEIAKVKAEYIKKRFSKDVVTDEARK